ncbi:hypothetical protein P7B02_03250 [Caulobacter segnis]|uniref:hypothetical protein n=1 Tax=Caulobacter segnis TaxID=88688 RepID=UPI00240FB753|nr:hypothetical protein [Caulobacter segnis]MDG2520547.1 hypothetical protein [Caulobacter segnis]
MPTQRKIAELTKVYGAEKQLLFYTIPTLTGGGRRSSSDFIRPEHVPAFEGESAWFELESFREGPWRQWRATRRVEPPYRPR